MNEQTLNALIKLTLCPGKNDGSELCSHCEFRVAGEGCAKAHKDSMYRQLFSELPGSAEHSRDTLEMRVTKELRVAGVPVNLQGYGYLKTAIMLVVDNPEIIHSIVKGLYSKVAKIHHTAPSRVERAIRHAIEVTWNRGDFDYLFNTFGYTVDPMKGKPTNSEFIALIADNIRLERV